LGVAKVLQVERQGEGGFARVTLAPAALADGVRHVLVLEPLSLQLPPRPEPTPEPSTKASAKAKKGGPAP
jgi:rod shape-determining protein MreC